MPSGMLRQGIRLRLVYSAGPYQLLHQEEELCAAGFTTMRFR
jgi:hypothetical protein